MSDATVKTTRQFGIRYPDGSTVWAEGNLDFTKEGNLSGAAQLKTMTPVRNGYSLDLANVIDSATNATHLKGQLRDLAKSLHLDPHDFINGHTVVSRQVLVITSEVVEHKLPTEDSPF